MVANLRARDITYDPKTGRYRSPFGGFISRADLKSVVSSERLRLEGRLTRTTGRLISGRLTLTQWQREISRQLKRAAIQLTVLGAGGRERTTRQQYRLTEAELRRQYGFLGRFAQQIKDGNLSQAQILARIKLYSNTIEIAFSTAEKQARIGEGKNQAWRRLDPQAAHCRQCLTYSTGGWVPISSVVPVGVNCDCGGNCRCSIAYRFNPQLIDLI